MPEIPDQPTYRAGRKALRTIYRQLGPDPSNADELVGLMDTPELAALVVAGLNRTSVAYRAGREDLLRSGSCPECAAGDPHNEPDEPHIHLTTYGYLLYAPSHDQLDFVRQIREIERRAGREDAARELANAAGRGLTQVARAGYEAAISTLLDVAQRTGSPAAQWAAEYLATDPDQRGKPPADTSWIQMTEGG